MTVRRRTKRALAILLPAGVLGISSALAATHTEVLPADHKDTSPNISSVSERLREIRTGVSALSADAPKTSEADAPLLIAEWINFGGMGWRNGGWGNGGWGRGHWGNGGWGNGGWGNGWHNGGWHNWHNFWHNW